jgi:bacterioferritin
MKGNAKLLEALNEILTGELTAINQYFIHAKMCDNWGFERLAHKNREESISEMKHADELIGTFCSSTGVPNVAPRQGARGRVGPRAAQADLQLDRLPRSTLQQGDLLAVDTSPTAPLASCWKTC